MPMLQELQIWPDAPMAMTDAKWGELLNSDGNMSQFGIDGMLSAGNLTLWARSNPVRCVKRGSSRLILNRSSLVPLKEWDPEKHQPMAPDGSVGTLFFPTDYSALQDTQRESFFRAAWLRALEAIGADSTPDKFPNGIFDPICISVPLRNISSRHGIRAVGRLDANGRAAITFFKTQKHGGDEFVIFEQEMGPTVTDWLSFGRLLKLRNGAAVIDAPYADSIELFDV